MANVDGKGMGTEARFARLERELAQCQARIAQLEARGVARPPAASDGLMGLHDDTRLYTPDLARVLGCSPRSIQRRVRDGKLPEPAWEGGKRVWLAGAIKHRYRELQQRAAMRNLRRGA